MNISDIEAFVALAETGSVNRAAIRLHITQPTTRFVWSITRYPNAKRGRKAPFSFNDY
ncbi:MAG: LysR family transcriptional regulator [Afipia sp.]|nr:LysR family transcriptional regulator [Afipia sp.]